MKANTKLGAEQWAALVANWESSDVSASSFASEHGVTESALRWWKRELTRRRQSEERRPPPQARDSFGGTIPLARVVRQGESGSRLSVVVGAVRIVVEQGFDRQLLRDVVRTLEEAR